MNITWRLNVISILLIGYWLLILKVIDLRGEKDLISNMMTPGCVQFLHVNLGKMPGEQLQV